MKALLAKHISQRQAAAYFGVGRAKIALWVRGGILNAINVGGMSRTQLRFSPAAIAEAEAKLAVQPTKPKRRRVRDAALNDPEVRRLMGLGVEE